MHNNNHNEMLRLLRFKSSGMDFVFVLDEDFDFTRSVSATVTNALRKLSDAGISLVISWNDRYGYQDIDFIEHYAIFHLYDPIEIIDPFRTNFRFSSRDISSLHPNQFIYARRSEPQSISLTQTLPEKKPS